MTARWLCPIIAELFILIGLVCVYSYIGHVLWKIDCSWLNLFNGVLSLYLDKLLECIVLLCHLLTNFMKRNFISIHLEHQHCASWCMWLGRAMVYSIHKICLPIFESGLVTELSERILDPISIWSTLFRLLWSLNPLIFYNFLASNTFF